MATNIKTINLFLHINMNNPLTQIKKPEYTKLKPLEMDIEETKEIMARKQSAVENEKQEIEKYKP